MRSVHDDLMTALTGKFEVDAEQIHPDRTLTDLGLDSLAVVELYVTLQEQWRVRLEEDETAGNMTIRQFCAAVTAQLPADGTPDDPGTAE